MLRRRLSWALAALTLLACVLVVGTAVTIERRGTRPATGLVFDLSNVNSDGGPAVSVTFGPDGFDYPVVGNWDRAASGRDTIGVSLISGSARRWILATGDPAHNTGTRLDFRWGSADCVPLAGDWQGTGDTVGQACRDERSHTWIFTLGTGLTSTGAGTLPSFVFGSIDCAPLAADWNGDGVDTVGVTCPSGAERTWLYTDVAPTDGAAPPTSNTFSWGSAICDPVVGNWDGVDGDSVGQVCADASGPGQRWSLTNHNSAGGVDAAFGWGSVPTMNITGDWDGTATDDHRNATTAGTVAGVRGPGPAAGIAPGVMPYGPSEVTHGFTARTRYVVDQLMARFDLRGCSGEADGTQTGHITGSDHYSGNAADCFPGAANVIAAGSTKRIGDVTADWLVRYGSILKLRYVIWYGRIYDFEDAPGWRPYCNPVLTEADCVRPPTGPVIDEQHFDHVHVSLQHQPDS